MGQARTEEERAFIERLCEEQVSDDCKASVGANSAEHDRPAGDLDADRIVTVVVTQHDGAGDGVDSGDAQNRLDFPQRTLGQGIPPVGDEARIDSA